MPKSGWRFYMISRTGYWVIMPSNWKKSSMSSLAGFKFGHFNILRLYGNGGESGDEAMFFIFSPLNPSTVSEV